MNKEVLEALRDGERDKEVRCFMITGAGRAFCAGQDLKGRTPEQKGSLGASLREKYNPLIRQIRQMEKIVIAAVNGVAAGAGCNFALACDLRVASEEAKFIQSFVRVGLAPDSGGSFILPRLVGVSKAWSCSCSGIQSTLKKPSASAWSRGFSRRPSSPDPPVPLPSKSPARRAASASSSARSIMQICRVWRTTSNTRRTCKKSPAGARTMTKG